MKRILSGLALPIAVFACIGAYAALCTSCAHCIYCGSCDVKHAPHKNQPYRYECEKCDQAFTRADDAPVSWIDVFDAYGRRDELGL